MLNMKNTKVIQLSPDKENMRYIVEKASGEIEKTFSWSLFDLNLFRGDREKTVIFCCSTKECGEIYETFLYNKSDHEQQGRISFLTNQSICLPFGAKPIRTRTLLLLPV